MMIIIVRTRLRRTRKITDNRRGEVLCWMFSYALTPIPVLFFFVQFFTLSLWSCVVRGRAAAVVVCTPTITGKSLAGAIEGETGPQKILGGIRVCKTSSRVRGCRAKSILLGYHRGLGKRDQYSCFWAHFCLHNDLGIGS